MRRKKTNDRPVILGVQGQLNTQDGVCMNVTVQVVTNGHYCLLIGKI